MVNHYNTRIVRDSGNYIVKLAERDGLCREIVFRNGEQIHYAEFPASNLWGAKRGEYLEVMGESIADKWEREA